VTADDDGGPDVPDDDAAIECQVLCWVRCWLRVASTCCSEVVGRNQVFTICIKPCQAIKMFAWFRAVTSFSFSTCF